MADALTRCADRLDAEARRLEKEVCDTRLEIQDIKIERLEAWAEHFLTVQDQLLATVIQQGKCISDLIRRDDALARLAGLRF